MAATLASIESTFVAKGYTGISVIPNRISRDGYVVVSSDRETAYSVARAVVNAFEADPEAGAVTVGVSEPTDGKYATVVTIDR